LEGHGPSWPGLRPALPTSQTDLLGKSRPPETAEHTRKNGEPAEVARSPFVDLFSGLSSGRTQVRAGALEDVSTIFVSSAFGTCSKCEGVIDALARPLESERMSVT